MFSKISARIFFKVLNAPTISSKAVCLRSLSSSNNIDDPLMRNVDLLQRKQRKMPSSVFNPAEANQLNILTERKEFMALFPDVLQDITELVDQKYKDKDLVDRIIRAVNYNIPNGKHRFGMSLIMIYLNLVDAAQLTPENMKMIRLLAWILEMLIASGLADDDIIDEGTVRRNQPCWYLVEDVKLTAVNDVLMLENLAHYLLKKYFRHFPCYPKLLDIVRKAYFLAVIGVHAESVYSRKGVQQFTMDEFKKVVYHKTTYGGLWVPFALPTMFIGIDTPELFRQTKPILLELGLYIQIQNDFYGCFRDSTVVRSITSEIESGQMNWLVVKGMELATPAQRKTLIECYGKHDSEKSKLVKQVYEELNLPHLYYQLEEETYDKLFASIKNLSYGQNDAVLSILNVVYNKI